MELLKLRIDFHSVFLILTLALSVTQSLSLSVSKSFFYSVSESLSHLVILKSH